MGITRWKIIAGMIAALIASAVTYTAELKKRTPMDIHGFTLWQLIGALREQASFSPDKVRRVLPVDFLKNGESSYFSFYTGGQLYLSDQVRIEAIDLRVKQNDETVGLIVLDIDPRGTCVTLDDVHAHYPDMVISGAPLGHSLNEKTYWSIQQAWGELSFGFKMRNLHCLATVVLDRADRVSPD